MMIRSPKKFFTFIALISLLVLTSTCRSRRKTKSYVKTTSDKLKEYSYIIEGELRIPLNIYDHYIVYLLDLYRVSLDHPENQSAADELNSALKNPEEFQTLFLKANRSGWPLKNGQQIDQSKVKFWISRQLRYTSKQLEKVGASLTLSSIESARHDEVNQELVVHYKAKTLGVANVLGGSQGDLSKSPIDASTILQVPQNISAGYFAAMGPEFEVFKTENLARLKQGKIRDFLSDERAKTLLVSTKTNAAKSPCYKSDGDHVSPFAFFYYFDPEDLSCAKLPHQTQLKVVEVRKMPVVTTYPEFHRLLEDKTVDLFYYLGSVGTEQLSAFQRMDEHLTKLGFTPVLNFEQKQYHKKLTKNLNGVSINVEFTAESEGHYGRQSLQSAIKTHEIVVYDGHAGYGANIDEKFTQSDSYPDNKYQIFVLNGCSTYKYGMSQLLDAKSIHDFDFYHQNVDVITTYTAVKGWETDLIILDRLLEVIPMYQANAWSDDSKSKFESKYSWLSLITEYNRISDESGKDNGVYMVSGEQYNDYAPGKTEFGGVAEVSAAQLRDLIMDESKEESTRILALKGYVKKYLRASSSEEFSVAIREAAKFCLAMNTSEGMASVLAALFYYPSCQPKELWLNGPVKYKGLEFAGTHSVLFHANGQVKQGMVAADVKFGKWDLLGGRPIGFFENGLVRAFFSAAEFKDEFGHVFSSSRVFGQVILHPNGRVRSAYVEAPVARNQISFRGEVEFDENGNAIGGWLEKNALIEGFQLKVEGDNFNQVVLFPSGKLKRLMGSGMIDTRTNKTHHASFEFFENGRLKSYMNIGEHEGAYLYNGTEYSSFIAREDGSLAMVTTASSFATSRLPCVTGGSENFVLYERDGTVVGCKLSKDFRHGEQLFEAGQYMVLTLDGRGFGENSPMLMSYLRQLGVNFFEVEDELGRLPESW